MSFLAPYQPRAMTQAEIMQAADQIETPLGSYLGSSFKEGLLGTAAASIYSSFTTPATLGEDEALKAATGQPTQALDEASFKASPNFRPGMPWSPGMTEARAAALASDVDAANWRQNLYAKYQGGIGGKALGIGAQFAGGALSPENYIPFFGPEMRAAMVARLGTVGGHAALAAGEGFLGTALTEPLIYAYQRERGQDYGLPEITADLLFGTAIGGAAGALHGTAAHLFGHGAPVVRPAPAVVPGEAVAGAGKPPQTVIGETPDIPPVEEPPAGPLETAQNSAPILSAPDLLQSAAQKRGAQEMQHRIGAIDPTDLEPYTELSDAIQAAPADFADIQAHGIAGAKPEEQLAQLLTGGIDQQRAFHTGDLGSAHDPTVRAAGLGAKVDSPYVLLFRGDPKTDGIGAVVVNGAAKAGLDDLRKAFPNVEFLTPDQVPEWKRQGAAAPDLTRSPRPAGDVLTPPALARETDALNAAADALSRGEPVDVGAMVPDKPPPEPGTYIDVFHGTPHTFGEFDPAHIGTGEGAQAYGHGLYFAEGRGIAEHYQQALGNNDTPYIDGKPIDSSDPRFGNAVRILAGVKPDEEIAILDRSIDSIGTPSSATDKAHLNALTAERNQWQELKSATVEKGKPGNLYGVRLHVRPDELLHWDKPLSEQPPKVREALDAMKARAMADESGRNPLMGFFGALGRADRSGEALYKDLSERLLSDVAASAALRDAGIPGIRYLDAGSRGAGEGTHNIVLFDPSRAEITHVNDRAVERPIPPPPSVVEAAPRVGKADDEFATFAEDAGLEGFKAPTMEEQAKAEEAKAKAPLATEEPKTPVGEAPKKTFPSVGDTPDEIWAAWKRIADRPSDYAHNNQQVLGLVPGEGTFSLRPEADGSYKLYRIEAANNRRGQVAMASIREATDQEWKTVEGAIEGGTFQIQAEPVGGVTGAGWAKAATSTTVYHQATGIPIPGTETAKRIEARLKEKQAKINATPLDGELQALRDAGRLTPEDEAALSASEADATKAEGWATAAETLANCVLRFGG